MDWHIKTRVHRLKITEVGLYMAGTPSGKSLLRYTPICARVKQFKVRRHTFRATNHTQKLRLRPEERGPLESTAELG
jgi:hypothetical protein